MTIIVTNVYQTISSMKVKIILFLIAIFSANLLSAQQTDKAKSSDYAVMYLECAAGTPISLRIQIYYEDGTIENYTEKNDIKVPCYTNSNTFVLIQVLKYMEEKGYQLISSSVTHGTYDDRHMEYIFRR